MTPQQPEREASKEDLEDFLDEVKVNGKASQHGKWNMSGVIFGVFLSSSALMSQLSETPVWWVTVSMLLSIIGLLFVWLCYHYQISFYAEFVRAGHEIADITVNGGNSTECEKTANVKLESKLNWQTRYEKLSSLLLFVGGVWIMILPYL